MAATRRSDHPRRTRRRRNILLGVAGLIVLALAVGAWGSWPGGSTRDRCVATPPGSSPATRRTPTRPPRRGRPSATPRSPRASNTALNATLPYTTRWDVNTGSLVELPPVIGDGRVVAGTNHGIAIALDLRTGAVDWRQRLGGAVAASPALTGLPGTPSAGEPRLDLFATISGELIALDPATGRRSGAWRSGPRSRPRRWCSATASTSGPAGARSCASRSPHTGASGPTRSSGSVKGAIARSGIERDRRRLRRSCQRALAVHRTGDLADHEPGQDLPGARTLLRRASRRLRTSLHWQRQRPDPRDQRDDGRDQLGPCGRRLRVLERRGRRPDGVRRQL